MGKLNLEIIQHSDNYKIWTRQQRQLSSLNEYRDPTFNHNKCYSRITTQQTTVTVDKTIQVPLHIFEWFKFLKNWNMEQTAKYIKEDRRIVRHNKAKFKNIRIQEKLVNKITQRWQNWPLEIVENPYCRSLPNAVAWSKEEVTKAITPPHQPDWILINMTMPAMENSMLEEVLQSRTVTFQF